LEKQEAVRLIRKKYIEEYKKHTSKKAKIAFFSELLKIADENLPDEYQYWCSGHLSLAKSELSVAVGFFKKSLEIDSEYAYPWNGLGLVYREQKNYAQAIEAFEKAISLDSEYVYPWNGLGLVYREQKNYAQAIEAFEKAISLDSEFVYPCILGATSAMFIMNKKTMSKL